MGDGDGVPGGDAISAFKNSRNSPPVRVGKKGVEWVTTSVCLRPPRLKRTAKPRGSALGSLSGIIGMPVELEKRTVMGVESAWK